MRDEAKNGWKYSRMWLWCFTLFSKLGEQGRERCEKSQYRKSNVTSDGSVRLTRKFLAIAKNRNVWRLREQRLLIHEQTVPRYEHSHVELVYRNILSSVNCFDYILQ